MIKSSSWQGNEIIYTSDQNMNATNLVQNLDFAFDILGTTTVITGMVVSQAASPSMIVQLSSGIAKDNGSGNFLVGEELTSVPVSAASISLARKDIIEIRRIIEYGSPEARQFKDPATEVITTTVILTEKTYKTEAKVLAGSPGGSAPAVESGWIKVAEILVRASTTSILDADIFNIDAEVTGGSNTGWTNDITSIYRNGSISDMKTTIVSNRERIVVNEGGISTLKDSIISTPKAIEVVFGKSSIISQEAFTITGNSNALFSSDIPILVLFDYDFGDGATPLVYEIPIFSDVALTSGSVVIGGATNYLYATFDPVAGIQDSKLHSSTSAPTLDTQVLLATYTATGTAGSYVITVIGENDVTGSLDKDFDEANAGIVISPDSSIGRLGKKFRNGFRALRVDSFMQREPTAFSVFGNSLSGFSDNGYSVIAMSPTRLCVFRDTPSQDLSTFEWDGTDWNLIGNPYYLTGVSDGTVTALTNTTIAMVQNGLDRLVTFEWDGTDWTPIGNPYSIATDNAGALTTLKSNQVAMINETTAGLRTYNWDGTDWTPIGNYLAGVGVDGSISALSVNTIVHYSGTSGGIQTYQWDETDWVTVGNLLIEASSVRLTAVSPDKIVAGIGVNSNLEMYSWNGTDWVPYKMAYEIAVGVGGVFPAAIAGDQIAVIYQGDETLQIYSIEYDLPPNPAFGTL